MIGMTDLLTGLNNELFYVRDFLQKLSTALLSNSGTQLSSLDISANLIEDRGETFPARLLYTALSQCGLCPWGFSCGYFRRNPASAELLKPDWLILTVTEISTGLGAKPATNV